MTRAKRSLTVHCNGNYLESIKTGELERIYNTEKFMPPYQIAIQLTYSDVWLDYLQCCQDLISKLRSGEELLVDGDGCRNLMDQDILKFSKQFKSQSPCTAISTYVMG